MHITEILKRTRALQRDGDGFTVHMLGPAFLYKHKTKAGSEGSVCLRLNGVLNVQNSDHSSSTSTDVCRVMSDVTLHIRELMHEYCSICVK